MAIPLKGNLTSGDQRMARHTNRQMVELASKITTNDARNPINNSVPVPRYSNGSPRILTCRHRKCADARLCPESIDSEGEKVQQQISYQQASRTRRRRPSKDYRTGLAGLSRRLSSPGYAARFVSCRPKRCRAVVSCSRSDVQRVPPLFCHCGIQDTEFTTRLEARILRMETPT